MPLQLKGGERVRFNMPGSPPMLVESLGANGAVVCVRVVDGKKVTDTYQIDDLLECIRLEFYQDPDARDDPKTGETIGIYGWLELQLHPDGHEEWHLCDQWTERKDNRSPDNNLPAVPDDASLTWKKGDPLPPPPPSPWHDLHNSITQPGSGGIVL